MSIPLEHLVQSVTKITLANNTALASDHTVPAGKRWKLLFIKATNPDNVDRQIRFIIYKEAAKTNEVYKLGQDSTAASGGDFVWPNGTSGDTTMENWHDLILMDEGNTLNVNFAAGGASAGGSDDDGLVITYLEVDL